MTFFSELCTIGKVRIKTPEETAFGKKAIFQVDKGVFVLSGGRVPDGTFKVLKEHLTDEAILELTYITCCYEMHATMCRALHLEYDEVAERIVEIAAPEDDLQKMDFMGAVDKGQQE